MARHDDLEEKPEPAGLTLSPRLVVGAVLALALALFVGQNTRQTKVEWLMFETSQPLWLILLVTAAVTLVVVELIGGARRHRKRKS